MDLTRVTTLLQRSFGLIVKAFVVPLGRISFENFKERPQRLIQLLVNAPELNNFSTASSRFCHRILLRRSFNLEAGSVREEAFELVASDQAKKFFKRTCN